MTLLTLFVIILALGAFIMSIAALMMVSSARASIRKIEAYLSRVTFPVNQRPVAPPKPISQEVPLRPPMPPQPDILPQQQPAYPTQQAGVVPPPLTDSSPKKLTEGVFGRNVLAVVASCLTFIGLIFLGVLVVPYLTQTAKIALMFLISTGLVTAGFLLTRRRPSILSQAFLGTGAGGLFISILVTHLYFHAMNDIVAFSLLAVWIACCLYLAKYANSLFIAILAHAGMVASIIAAYMGGINDRWLILLMVYQIVATVIIIVGNIIWCRQMYRFSLFATQALVVASLSVMWARLTGITTEHRISIPPSLVTSTFLVQFVGGTAIAYLLFVSCARIKNKTAGGWVAALNSILWVVVCVEAVTALVNKMVTSGLRFPTVGPGTDHFHMATLPVVLTLILWIIPVVLVAVAGSRLQIGGTLTVGTVIPLAAASAVLLTVYCTTMDENGVAGVHLTWIIGLAVIFLALGQWTKAVGYLWIGRALLIVDAAIMVFTDFGYESLSSQWTVWASVAYLVVLIGLTGWTWLQVPSSRRSTYTRWVVMGAYFGFEASLLKIIASSDGSGLWTPSVFALVSVVVLAVVWIVCHDDLNALYDVATVASIFFTLASGAGGGENVGPTLLSSGAAIILGVLFIDRMRRCARSRPAPGTGQPSPVASSGIAMSAAGFTVVPLALCVPYSWFTGGYPLSFVLMVVSVAVVILGLWLRVKPLRLYGLILVIICVLKLALVDIGSVSAIVRVVAFLGGAVVCFGISALYNYAAKRFDTSLAEDAATGGPPTPGVGATMPPSPVMTQSTPFAPLGVPSSAVPLIPQERQESGPQKEG